MTLSLAADVLHYIPEELDSLAQHIQTTGGGLTSPVMQVYEEDIRTPIKSAIRGTLIRGILVQVQKAKVCLSFSLGVRNLEFYELLFKNLLFFSCTQTYRTN